MSEKSCLDNVPVDDTQYKQHMKRWSRDEQQGQELLSIVSHCPKCGSPIYGKQLVPQNETPSVKRSCNCSMDGVTNSVVGQQRTT